MAKQIAATKGNLIATRKSLSLAKLGYDLMDRKRHILVREMMQMIDRANDIQAQINETYSAAYLSLQKANITLGICEDVAAGVDLDDSLDIRFRSVMGVEIPLVSIDEQPPGLQYGLVSTNSYFDEAFLNFHAVKLLTAKLAEVESSVYRLASAVRQTQKRANALKNIVIPQFENDVKWITDTLEEKEREDFSRLKVIKNQTAQT